jgi:hypothetical protein
MKIEVDANLLAAALNLIGMEYTTGNIIAKYEQAMGLRNEFAKLLNEANEKAKAEAEANASK